MSDIDTAARKMLGSTVATFLWHLSDVVNKEPSTARAIMERALDLETAGDKRETVIKALSKEIKKLRKAAPLVVPPTDDETKLAIDSVFGPARKLIESIKLHTSRSIVGQVVLGLYLKELQSALGYSRGGDRKSNGKVCRLTEMGPSIAILNGMARTWEEWITKELGMPDRSARHLMQLAYAVRQRLKSAGGSESVLRLTENADPEAQEKVIELVRKVTDGETQASLLEDLGIYKRRVTLQGGAVATVQTDEDPALVSARYEQQLLELYCKPIVQLQRTLRSEDSEKALWVMPLSASDDKKPSLMQLEGILKMELDRISQIRAKRERGESMV